MGARQSKRSVDITTTPKKGDGEGLAEGEGKLEKIGDADVKVATNGTLPHNDLEVGVSTIFLCMIKCMIKYTFFVGKLTIFSIHFVT